MMSNKEIKILLIRKDIKQADIARKLKVSTAAICRVIKGNSESRRIKRAIAKALEVDVKDLWPNGNDKAA